MAYITTSFRMVAGPAFGLLLACLGLETLKDNALGWFLLALGTGYPAGEILAYLNRRQALRDPGQSRPPEFPNGRQYAATIPGILLILFAPPIEWLYLPPLVPRTPSMENAGISLLLSGMALLTAIGLYARRLPSAQSMARASRQRVPLGAHRVIRLAAAGILTSAFGLALGYSSLIGLLAVPGLLLPGLGLTCRAMKRSAGASLAREALASQREADG